MEVCLEVDPWLAGNTYSLADIAYTPYLTRYDHLQALGVLDKRPHLSDLYERVKARPNYAKGIGEWLNDKYLLLMKELKREQRQDLFQMLDVQLNVSIFTRASFVIHI